ncbi:MAG: glycosyltransferase, partial [Elusimicrobia bacterium]|nr:glycosyltransferase [Elusimicrobiota bacterium]
MSAASLPIAHFRTPFLSYSETFIYGYLCHLKPPFQPVVLTRKQANGTRFPFERVENYATPKLSPRWTLDNLAKRAFGVRDVSLQWRLRRLGVVLLHAHFGEEGYALLQVKNRMALPLVTSFYGYDVSEVPRISAWRRRYSRLFREGDLFLVEGSHMRKSLMELGCPKDKIRIQRIAVDLQRIPFRKRVPGDPRKTVFLFCGRFIEKKGVMDALRAFRSVAGSGLTDFEFRIIGDGPLRPELTSYVKANGLDRRVVFLGIKSHQEFYQELDAADVYISPSVTAENGDSEGGAPTTLIEAQASGLPVITTTHADIPEIVLPGRSALLSPERDPESLARHIAFFMKNPGVRAPFGLDGRRHVERNHDIRIEARKLEGLYSEALYKTAAKPGAARAAGAGEAAIPADLFRAGGWTFFMDLKPKSRLLSIDRDHQEHALAAAYAVSDVFCLSPDEAQAQATARRALSLGLNRVEGVVAKDPARLPFPDAHFHCVAVHDPDRLARGESVKTSFDELLRVLSPDGGLFISFRKRKIIDFFRPRSRRGPSLYAVLKHFSEQELELLHMKDDAAGPGLYCIERVRKSGSGWRNRLLPLQALLSRRSFALIVRRRGAQRHEPFVSALSRHGCGNGRGGEALYMGSGGVYRIETGTAILRVPLDETYEPRCRNNYLSLKMLEGRPLPFDVPRCAGFGEFQGRKYYAETRLDGTPADYLKIAPAERRRLTGKALDALRRFQSATEASARMNDELFRRLFAGPAEELSGFLGEVPVDALRSTLRELRGALFGVPVRLTCVHGDYKIANILWDKRGEVSGVVDWDMASPAGLPWVDRLICTGFDRML